MRLEAALLSSFARIEAGGGAPQNTDAFSQCGHPFVRAGSLSKLIDGSAEQSLEHIEPEVASKYRLTLFPSNTVVFAKSGMSATKGLIYRLKEPAYIVNHLAALVPHDPLDSAFLVHALRKFSPTSLINDPTYPSIRLNDIANMKILAPLDPAERQHVAAILDQAEALWAKRRAALAQLDTLAQSIFLDMFGDPAANPRKWPIITLEEVISEGPQNGLYKPSSEYGQGTPILRIDAFYDGVVSGLDSLKRVRLDAKEVELYGLRASDIVINRVNSREYLGKSALIPKLVEPTVFESNMMRLRLDDQRARPGFVIQFLQTPFTKMQMLQKAKNAINQSSINQKDVGSLRLYLPPVSMQDEFISRARYVEQLRIELESSSLKLGALFASLQHDAFRGEM